MSIKAYKFRLYPNKATSEKLQWVLDHARELYNAALAERKEAYRMCGKSISYYEQKRDLPDIKELRAFVSGNCESRSARRDFAGRESVQSVLSTGEERGETWIPKVQGQELV